VLFFNLNTYMKKYHIIRNAIEPQTLRLIKYATLIMKNNQYFINNVPLDDHNAFADGEPVDHDCWGMYGTPQSESLLIEVLPMIQDTFGIKVHPSYSFTRIYWTGSDMKPHLDRPSCEYSASVCIDVDSEPWGIWFEGEELMLNPGDLVVYKGCEIKHWREPYKGKQQIQVFLHYVDQNGPHANEALDGRPMLGLHHSKKHVVPAHPDEYWQEPRQNDME